MALLKKLNPLKRKIMRRLVGRIGKSNFPFNADLHPSGSLRILVIRPNHRLGNLLLITPLLQEINCRFPNAKIDLFVKGKLSGIVFQKYSALERIIELPRRPFDHFREYLSGWIKIREENYDLVINIDKGSSSGTVATAFAKSRYKIYGQYHQEIDNGLMEQKHMAKTSIFELRALLAPTDMNDPVPTLNLKLSQAEILNGEKNLRKIISHPDKKIISLFTYATGEKCYPKVWWGQFFELLQSSFPDHEFIEILPIENISNLSFCIPSFYSRDIREIASVIANTSLFIGADSGIMHLASSTQIPTLGLFAGKKEFRYAPYGKGRISINTTRVSMEESLEVVEQLLESELIQTG